MTLMYTFNMDLFERVSALSEGFTKVIPRDQLTDELDWGRNGIGDRWAGKKFNYTVVYKAGKEPTHTYSEDENDEIPHQILTLFMTTVPHKSRGIVGIFVHSERKNITLRPIKEEIRKIITSNPCVICGSTTNIICDHKNDAYNDLRVLSIATQTLEDFQPLCEHCNLQKRQVAKKEREQKKHYSAKTIQSFKMYPFAFPWEKYAFPYGKKDSYWYDPVDFNRKSYIYLLFTPVRSQIRLTPQDV